MKQLPGVIAAFVVMLAGFWLAEVLPRYRLALAVRASSGTPPSVTFQDIDGRRHTISVYRASHGR